MVKIKIKLLLLVLSLALPKLDIKTGLGLRSIDNIDLIQQKEKTSLLEGKLKELRKLSKEAGLPQKELPRKELCLEDGCLEAAFDLIRAINGTVDPCKDFYSFSCGKWIEKNPVPPHLQQYGQIYILDDKATITNIKILSEAINPQDSKQVNQAKEVYRACLNLKQIERVGLKPLKKFISELGGWQLLDPDGWNASAFNWLHSEAELMRRTMKSSLITVYTYVDEKNTSRRVLYLDQPNLGLPLEYLIDADSFLSQIYAYEDLIYKVARQLGSTQTEMQLYQQIYDMISLEISLARISSSPEDRSNHERMYNLFTLDQFQALTDSIDKSGNDKFTINWKEYLDQVSGTSGVKIAKDEPIVVRELRYIKKLISILKRELKNPITLANLIIWRAVSAVITHTTKKMRHTSSPGSSEQTREETCAKQASDAFGGPLGLKFIEKTNFFGEAKSEVNEMVENIFSSVKEMLIEADWMRNETKTEAIKKANAMGKFLGYADYLSNETATEEFYEGLELGEEGHFSNQLSLLERETDSRMKEIRKPMEKEANYNPGGVEASYTPGWNVIVLTAGILQPPLFGKSRPKHQNYGAIGSTIGHEITHGFDNEGSQYDKDGSLVNWWDPATKEEFEKRSKCMVDQYSSYRVKSVGMNINGLLTLGENIADNGGLRQSFRAYQKYVREHGRELRLPGLEEFSPEQLFFLGFAHGFCTSETQKGLANMISTDPHSPAEYRVNGAVKNFEEFSKAYGCPVDANGMNPPHEKRCRVW